MSDDKEPAVPVESSGESESDSDIEFILEPEGSSSTAAAASEPKSTEEATEDAIIKQSGDAAADTTAQAAKDASSESSLVSSTAAGPVQKGTLDIDAIGEFEGKPIPAVIPGNLEEKPWRRPGTDLSDYFNYGFDEYTWMAYCNRQDKLRAHFTPQQVMSMGMPMGGMPGMPPMPNMPNMPNMNMPNMPNMGMMPPFMMPPMMFPPQPN